MGSRVVGYGLDSHGEIVAEYNDQSRTLSVSSNTKVVEITDKYLLDALGNKLEYISEEDIKSKTKRIRKKIGFVYIPARVGMISFSIETGEMRAIEESMEVLSPELYPPHRNILDLTETYKKEILRKWPYSLDHDLILFKEARYGNHVMYVVEIEGLGHRKEFGGTTLDDGIALALEEASELFEEVMINRDRIPLEELFEERESNILNQLQETVSNTGRLTEEAKQFIINTLAENSISADNYPLIIASNYEDVDLYKGPVKHVYEFGGKENLYHSYPSGTALKFVFTDDMKIVVWEQLYRAGVYLSSEGEYKHLYRNISGKLYAYEPHLTPAVPKLYVTEDILFDEKYNDAMVKRLNKIGKANMAYIYPNYSSGAVLHLNLETEEVLFENAREWPEFK